MNRLPRHTTAIIAGFAVSMGVGCAAFKSDWKDDVTTSNRPVQLVSPKIDSGSVGLDVSFVSILAEKSPPTQSKRLAGQPGATAGETEARSGVEEVWRWIDETIIEPKVRAELRLNGLRVGRVHTHSEFGRALAEIRRLPQDQAAKLLASAAVGSDVTQASRRIPCRIGKRYELPVRQPAVGQVATLVSLGGQTIGKTLDAPQPMFAVTMQPSDTTSVRMKLQPEIQYGAMKQTWVSNDSALRIDNRRDSWSMPDLGFEVQAVAGAVLVIGAVMPPHGLGQQMFTGKTADGDTDHVLMLIHVADLPSMMAK
jgi:hypothetical protein